MGERAADLAGADQRNFVTRHGGKTLDLLKPRGAAEWWLSGPAGGDKPPKDVRLAHLRSCIHYTSRRAPPSPEAFYPRGARWPGGGGRAKRGGGVGKRTKKKLGIFAGGSGGRGGGGGGRGGGEKTPPPPNQTTRRPPISLLWTVFLTLPFMAAIQIISACIGWNTRRGLARNIARVLPPLALYPLVASLLVANTINIAADLAAMGEALRLVVGGSALVFAVLFGIACLVAEVLIPYHRYAGYLKLMTLVLLFYVAAAFSVHIPWGEVAHATLFRTFSLDRDQLLMVVAVFGTTISPYLFSGRRRRKRKNRG